MKKTVSSIMALITVLVISVPVYAEEEITTDIHAIEQEIQMITSEFHNVVDITYESIDQESVDMSKAIIIDSEEDYYRFLENLAMYSNIENTEIVYMPVNYKAGISKTGTNNGNVSTLASYVLYGSTYTSKIASSWISGLGTVDLPLPPMRINMCFDFTVGGTERNPKFETISNKQAWLSGLNFPVAYDWTVKSHNHYLSSDKTLIDFTITGVIGMTLVYKGLPKLMLYNVSYGFSYGISSAVD